MSNRKKFHPRKGQQQMDKFSRKVEKEDISDDVCDELKLLNYLIYPRAIPMSITTRGVGFATVLFYEQALSAWNRADKTEIASIFTIYRVHLWLMYHKVYCAQQIQVDSVTSSNALVRISIQAEKREELHCWYAVPKVFNMVLRAIGRIETEGNIYHLGFCEQPTSDPDLIKYQTLVQTPKNIRATLDRLSTADTPLNIRQAFIDLNPIPGARFENNLLVNADEIWPPGYSTSDLRSDISAYKNLISRVQLRLPKGTFSPIAKSGIGDIGGLWSSKDNGGKIISEFEPEISQAASTQKYKGGSISGSLNTEWYSREKTNQISIALGIGSMIGEECFLATRHKIHAGHVVAANSVTILDKVSW